MPWTPIPKFPKIIENLNNSGRNGSVGLIKLEDEIMMETGVIKDATIKRIIQLMERFGFIKKISIDGSETIWIYGKEKIAKYNEEQIKKQEDGLFEYDEKIQILETLTNESKTDEPEGDTIHDKS